MDKGYLRIDGDNYRHIYIVGDLHGCFDILEFEIEKTGFDRQQDLLLSVGDLVDRGPKSLECLEMITEPWFKAVRGNHEMLMFAALNEHKPDSRYWWEVNGGNWFYESLDHSQQDYVRSLAKRVPDLPFVIELVIDSKRVIVAHADYPSSRYEFGKEINHQNTIWDRDRVGRIIDGFGGAAINGADLFVFGHTPVKEPLQYGNILYIDTGAFHTSTLTLVKLK